MTYINWMKKTYGEENSPKGNLARDIRADEKFPKNGVGKFDGWRRLLRSYLESHSACNGCLASFDESWKEYEACERRRLNRPLSGR